MPCIPCIMNSIQALTLEAGGNFARAGLARHAEPLDARLVFLPADPETDVAPLDQETLAWLKEPRPSSAGGPNPSWGSRDRATSGALVIYDQYRDDAGWARYLGLHRHGGLEVGLGHLTHQIRGVTGDIRVFPLTSIVTTAWALAALQREAVERWQISLPFEFTVAVRDTGKATLGGFAEGWAEPGHGLWDFSTCLEDHVLLRYEVDDAIDPQRYAVDLGDRLEQAFGSINRRHFARTGEHTGDLDPRW
jgi:hypothetical protein